MLTAFAAGPCYSLATGRYERAMSAVALSVTEKIILFSIASEEFRRGERARKREMNRAATGPVMEGNRSANGRGRPRNIDDEGGGRNLQRHDAELTETERMHRLYGDMTESRISATLKLPPFGKFVHVSASHRADSATRAERRNSGFNRSARVYSTKVVGI